MPIRYDSVVPWGRSYEEYVDMFRLTGEDMNKKILGCGDGPASFNSEMNKTSRKMTSFDPIYRFTKDELQNRINVTREKVIKQTEENRDRFVWKRIRSLEHLVETRLAAMNEFLSDFENGKKEGRYVDGELPVLPFDDGSFDIVLSAHFLLFYSENLSLEFHFKSIDEMLRVGKEIRIFPILDLNACISKYLEPLKEYLDKNKIRHSEEKVDYEFQKNGNMMLRIMI
jgi:hypothetical protein